MEQLTFFQGTIYLEWKMYVINLDDKNTKGTHSGSLYIDKKSSVLLFFWNWIYSSNILSIKQNQRQINYSQYL